MKKLALLVVLVAFLVSGCATAFPMGTIYTDVKIPVAGNQAKYSKTGVAKTKSYMGVVAIGDSSIQAAMANGKITKISFVDYKAYSILGIIGEYTTTVYGD
jgi:hypothetical protein